MDINGIIAKEELDNVIEAYLKTYRTTKRFFLIGKIFWILYILLLLFLLVTGIVIKNGMLLLVFLFCIPIAISSLRNNFKNTGLLKTGSLFANTDIALAYPDEYSFSVDDEKVSVNDKITVYFSSVATSAVYNEYTILVDNQKCPVVIKTDNESQWQIFEILKKLDKPGFIIPGDKNKLTGNEKILEYSRTVAVKSKQKNKRRVFLMAVVIAVVGYLGMYIVGSMNNQSAKDKNIYSYDENAGIYVTSQMAEKYAETESYKALLDIYFDWAAKECKSVVAVKYIDGTASEMDILFKDADGASHYIRYTDSEKALVRLIDFPFDEGISQDWENEVKRLSNYEQLANSYPYILDIFSVIGMDIELILKDNNLFTIHDEMYIFLTPAFYSCGNEKEDYYYVVSVSEKDVEQPEQLLEYFNTLADRINKTPYYDMTADDTDKIMEEVKAMLEKHCKVSMAETE